MVTGFMHAIYTCILDAFENSKNITKCSKLAEMDLVHRWVYEYIIY